MKKHFTKLVCAALTATMAMSCLPVSTGTNFVYPFASVVDAAGMSVYDCQGVQEAAYIEWGAVSGTSRYYVSYSKDGSNYTYVDDSLIRQYPDRWRADLIGLSAGEYTVKVEAEDSSAAIIAEATATCTVVAQDRTGFTFSPKSTAYDNGGCGAYNADGTLKDGANVLYVTESNFDSVTLNIKNKDGKDYTATGVADICKTMGAAANKGVTNPPLALRFIGTIGDTHTSLASPSILETKADKGNAKVNITFEGVGQDTIFNGLGLRFNGIANCEIRNISFYNWHDDAIQLQGNENSNHWIHNNDIFYGENHGGDQAKGDGATDLKDDSRYITYSYNRYWDCGKTSLCGMKSETGDNYISYHHNWFDHSDSRHPRIRTMFVHVYNNYYDGNSKYGVGAANSSSAFVEGNYFRNCKHPMLSSLQGSDIMENEKTGAPDFSGDGTFSGEPGGIIKAYNNHIEGSDGNELAGGVEPVYYNAADTTTNGAATQFDAYLVSSRDEQVPASVKALSGGKTFNNANVDDYVLSIPVESPEVAKDKAMNYAGRTGNHFAFTFTAADDTDYEINTALASKLTSYVKDTSDDYVSIGGASDGSGPVSTSTTTTESTTETTTTSSDDTTETTTNAPSGLTPLAGESYDTATIIADSTRFTITGNNSTTGQIKIDETGSVSFAVNANANVTITYKCGSSNASKSSSISCAGKTSDTLIGGSPENTLVLENLNAGEYKITAAQNGGTTAQIVSIAVTYGDTPVVDGLWGDADSSGGLTSNDSAVILLYTLDPAQANLTDKVITLCNVDAEGAITSADAAYVLQKVLDSEIKFPAEQ